MAMCWSINALRSVVLTSRLCINLAVADSVVAPAPAAMSSQTPPGAEPFVATWQTEAAVQVRVRKQAASSSWDASELRLVRRLRRLATSTGNGTRYESVSRNFEFQECGRWSCGLVVQST